MISEELVQLNCSHMVGERYYKYLFMTTALCRVRVTFIIDLPISINVCFSDHLINFLICKFLSQVCHHMSQLSSTNETISIFVKHSESFSDFFFTVSILHFPCHHGKKFREINCSITCFRKILILGQFHDPEINQMINKMESITHCKSDVQLCASMSSLAVVSLEIRIVLNPLTLLSDQERISPFSINIILNRQVMRMEKRIT